MSDIILISDGEEVNLLSYSGPSRGRAPPLRAPIFIDDSDDETIPTLADISAALSTDRKGKRKAISTSTTARSGLLDLLDDDSLRRATSSDEDIAVPLAQIVRQKAPTRRKKTASTDVTLDSDAKEAEAAARRAEREAAKNQEKADKQKQREQAKVAKEAAKSLAKKEREVNKLRISKNDTVREVHLYFTPDLLSSSSPIAGALPEIRTRIEGNESQLHTLPDDLCVVPGTIRFKRHVKAKYDGQLRRWVPLARDRWEWESTVLLVVTAEEVVDHVATDGLADWAADARLTLSMQANDQMLVMVKGLQKYYNKTKSIANREFTAAARAGLGERDPVPRARGARPEKEVIERELVKLQVAQRCFLVHVEKTEDIEDWVFNLAADIAIRPYKLLQKAHLNFCPTDGVKKGSTPLQTFELMLQEVQGVTPSAAVGIAAEYPGFKDLMEAYERAERKGMAEEMLQDCEVRNLRNGTANGRRLNKALSKRVYQVFRGEDSLALA